MVSIEETEILKIYTKTPKVLLERMSDAIEAAKHKRNCVKKVKVIYSLIELDRIIRHIANKANEHNSSNDVQYVLNKLFGRFAEKYNQAITNSF